MFSRPCDVGEYNWQLRKTEKFNFRVIQTFSLADFYIYIIADQAIGIFYFSWKIQLKFSAHPHAFTDAHDDIAGLKVMDTSLSANFAASSVLYTARQAFGSTLFILDSTLQRYVAGSSPGPFTSTAPPRPTPVYSILPLQAESANTDVDTHKRTNHTFIFIYYPLNIKFTYH